MSAATNLVGVLIAILFYQIIYADLLIKGSIKAFKNGKETFTVYDVPEEGSKEIIESYRGIDSDTYDLNTLFEEYFPNLQRRGALITLFAFLEHELDKLCDIITRTQGFPIILKDINGKGIDRSSLYLRKVAGLSIDNSTSAWNEIRRIQAMRNSIAHRNGNLTTDDISYVQGSSLLDEKGGDLVIKEGYLDHVIDVFNNYFRDIHLLIKQKY